MSAESEAALPAETPPSRGNQIEEFFKFAERGTNFTTEARAGLTTFMVMAYIIFLNPSILMGGFKDVILRSRRSRSRPARR